MKTDLITSIGVAIIGFLAAFFVTNLLIPELEAFNVQTLDDTANTSSANGYNYADLTDPDPEIFNYDALNPTVEVYVGECTETDENGNCIEESEDENSNQTNPEADDQESE